MSKHLSVQEQDHVIAYLKFNKLIGQIWPVYSWDHTPPVFGLLASDEIALASVRSAIYPDIGLEQFRSLLKRQGIAPMPSPNGKGREEDLIADFYLKRRDRMVKKYPLKTPQQGNASFAGVSDSIS